MLSHTDIRDILRDAVILIRELSRDAQSSEHIEQIHLLSDTVHNIPTLLYDWNILESCEPQKLEFLISTFE
jgi:hypothetical protein